MDVGLLSDLFACQVKRAPDFPAVIDGDVQVGYAALDARSNRLAHTLRAAGAGPESLVGVCIPRSLDLIVALLAVWKAGAAFVPLDPGHPVERSRWVLADTGARAVLVDRMTRQRMGETGVVAITADAPQGGMGDWRDSPPTGATPANAAYAIYTSGSTGHPKGVLVSHAAITNRVLWTVGKHGLDPADRVLQKTTTSFDAAVWEIFAPLVSGGTVVLAPPGAERDPAALLGAVARFDVTVLQVVPSLLRLLVDEKGWDDCGSLRLLFSAGEPLDAELCRRLRSQADVEVWNTYGPTECAIDVTAQRVDSDQVSGRVPIGRPISNMRVVVLDPAGQPVPIGVPGELHAAGTGVARGYVGQAGLTAECFVPDPYGPPGSRMYRTGDRVRWRDNGTLEYLGRLDSQVKVNGVRIEPGEVESALSDHPDVRGAAVTSREGVDGVIRLVAYVSSRDGEIPPDRLRGYLRRTLPDQLIPSVFVPMDVFPLTMSGKVDRAALPAPELGRAAARPAGMQPLSAIEMTIAQVWAELLGVEDVAADDDFFQLGGSSLLLAKLAGRLGAALGREIAVQDLFTASTVADQARLGGDTGRSAGSMRAVPRDLPLPLSFEQHQLWFLDRMQPGSPEWVTPLLVRLPGDLTVETVRRALEALVARHEILRTRYLTKSREPRQMIDEPASPPLRVIDSSGNPMELSRHIAAEFAAGFDLARGPVWRALLVRSPGEEHMLVLAVHHIASDGRSSVVLGEDVRELCTAIAAGGKPELAPLPVQYADYAVWQRERLTDEVLEPHVRFWRQALEGVSPLELPTDRPRPAVRDPRGAALTFTVPTHLARGVADLSKRRGATPFATFLTVFAGLLARWSGQWDVTLGAPVAGRNRPELSRVAGPFLNSLVLRCRLAEDLSFEDALDRVRGSSRGAFAHQDLPFERVVEALHPVRDLSRTPLYQVMFNVMDEGVTVTGTGDLDALRGAWHVAKTDLTLFLYLAADGGVTGILEYATSLFDESTIARMADQFVRLLDAVLADPAASLSMLGAAADAPHGAIEHRMAEIWAELLGREVGVAENFFQAGGTSRLAMVLIAQLQEDFDLDLPVRLIFERPTIARLSQAMKELAGAELARLEDSRVAPGSTMVKEPNA